MLTAVYVIIGILCFGFLIAIHEFGHFFTAKLSGIQVNEYSIGMGPKLLQRKKGETLYTLRLLPIGGYCAMEGEDGDSDNPRAFSAVAWWKRLIVLVAGAGVNFFAGFLILLVLYGFFLPLNNRLEIQSFMAGNILEEQGLQVGDTVRAIDGKSVYSIQDYQLITDHVDTASCELTVLRGGEKLTFSDFDLRKRELTTEDGKTGMYVGVIFGGVQEKNVWTVTQNAWHECVLFGRSVWYGLQDLITGRAKAEDVGGAVMIVDVMVENGKQASSFGEGLLSVLWVVAVVAVNLAIMNLLPIPALDGGRVLFLLIGTVYTAITKKKINPKYEAYINGVAMILLLILMAVIMIKDIYTIASR